MMEMSSSNVTNLDLVIFLVFRIMPMKPSRSHLRLLWCAKKGDLVVRYCPILNLMKLEKVYKKIQSPSMRIL
ncbi:hypothetical protein COOONC_22519 [Cooperia oncophora]